jgi:hypothetical protein
MKTVKNQTINQVWEDNLPKIYSKLLREVSNSFKIVQLLESSQSRHNQIKLNEWADSIIELTESNFNTFAYTNLHFQLSSILYDYMSAEVLLKNQSNVSIF